MKTNEIRKTLNEIDAKFADIQKYINNIDFLDDNDKGSLSGDLNFILIL